MRGCSSLEHVANALQSFRDYVREQIEAGDDIDLDLLLTNYVQLRRVMSQDVKGFAIAILIDETSLLDALRSRIAEQMVARYGNVAPAELLIVRGYGAVHAVILEFLSQRIGQAVSISRIRAISGDQVHTERRVRDLRDLGLTISWRRTAGEDRYILASVDADLDMASRCQLRKNLRENKSLGAALRRRLMAVVGAPVP